MTILIKGMEMPENCGECKFFAWKRTLGNHCAICEDITFHPTLDGFDVRYDHKGDCPLVPIPTPHGRLIDADEFFEKIPPGDIEHDEKISRTGAIADVCTWVLSAPTVIEAEADKE